MLLRSRVALVALVGAAGLSSLTACSPGRPLTAYQAEAVAQTVESNVVADRIAAKLMTWADWRRGEEPSPADPGPALPPLQLVWAVALHDQAGGGGSVVLLDAVTGSRLFIAAGHWSWPPYWDRLPNLVGSPAGSG